MPDPASKEHSEQPPPFKPWPLSWILIVILLYILFQTTYFLFFTE